MATRSRSAGNNNGGAKAAGGKTVSALQHADAKRRNIPTAEYQSVLEKQKLEPVRVAYPRSTISGLDDEKANRDRDLDPQLVWRGKDRQDWSDLVVHAPPLYIQEKVHAKALVDDLIRFTPSPPGEREGEGAPGPKDQIDLFADFNGIAEGADKTEFYAHDQNWSNRMILGDSLQVMASLAEREGLRGKVQCIYLDPPYGIRFNSNFQWSTTSSVVKDGNAMHITREPEQVKAFRDAWRDGVHSYLTYLRDRLTVARDLLADSGSVFVQIGEDNVHLVRGLLDEVFGSKNYMSQIAFRKTSGKGSAFLDNVFDFLLWYGKRREAAKFKRMFFPRLAETLDKQYSMLREGTGRYRRLRADELDNEVLLPARFKADGLYSESGGDTTRFEVDLDRRRFATPGKWYWKTNRAGMARLAYSDRLVGIGNTLCYRRMADDFPVVAVNDYWVDTMRSGFSEDRVYVVQTSVKVVERCLHMTTDPGDLVLDPTCGSGTTAYVAEQWGRRWITIDTSRVALALARARIMGARYPYYLLADSREGQSKEAEVTRTVPSSAPVHGNVRHGFVYERVPHVTLKSIANNAEIDVIWEDWQKTLEPLRAELNAVLGRGARPSPRPSPQRGEGVDRGEGVVEEGKKAWEEWEIPREADAQWPDAAKKLHARWWQARIARQKAIDASIAAKAEVEYLYDKPYPDPKKVRVAGPFTVESLSPHRVLGVDENDELIDTAAQPGADYAAKQSFPQMILENLKTAGVQQARKEGRIAFTSLQPWPGDLVCAEGRYVEGGDDGPSPQPSPRRGEGAAKERRAAIFIGPEFGTVTRVDLVAAAREARDAGFDVLIACAFNYEAHTTEFNKLADLPVLKARMNADLHMAEDLKNTGKGNLFVVFGEPDISLLRDDDGRIRVKINGVDVFHPNSGEVRSDGPDGIACWFIDTDYNEESFFVRHAYFLGANDPYKALKTTLKAEVHEDAWASLHSDTSRPFDRPRSGRIAVKVINHLGDEVMKVFKVEPGKGRP